jgi:hypothetical protein
MSEHEERQRDAALGARLKRAVDESAGSPGSIDAAILEAARAAGATIRSRPSRSRRWPALAASFVLGALLTGATLQWLPRAPQLEEPLLVPVTPVLRDGTTQSQSVAAESVAPQVWYDYIEQLVYAGRLEEAERHLRRFNELHPGFQPEP